MYLQTTTELTVCLQKYPNWPTTVLRKTAQRWFQMCVTNKYHWSPINYPGHWRTLSVRTEHWDGRIGALKWPIAGNRCTEIQILQVKAHLPDPRHDIIATVSTQRLRQVEWIRMDWECSCSTRRCGASARVASIVWEGNFGMGGILWEFSRMCLLKLFNFEGVIV